jgi:hypothetical protein
MPVISRWGDAMRTNRLLRRKAASQYLDETWGMNRAPSTLAKLAVIGGGPIFRRAGRVPVYATEDLDNWARSLMSVPMRSTSDATTAKASAADPGHDAELGGTAMREVSPDAHK